MTTTYPQRTCIGCQETSNKKLFVRFVRSPEGVVDYDSTGKANGRGAYVCPQTDCFDTACKRRAFDRALKVSLNADDYDRLRMQFNAHMSRVANKGKECDV